MCKQICSDSFKNKFTDKWYMYNHLTVWKQMTDDELNCMSWIAILETIYLCSNKWLFPDKWYMHKHLTVWKQMTDDELNCMCWIVILETIYLCSNKRQIVNKTICVRNNWNHLTVCPKNVLWWVKNFTNKMCLKIICLIYMYEQELGLNNRQGLMCNKN